MASNLDSTKRENMALTNNIEIFRKSEEQLRQENSSLKELVNNIEIERIHFRATCELLQRELSFAKKENASYIASENKIMNFSKPGSNVHNYPTQMSDMNSGVSTPGGNYQHLLPQSDLSKAPTPTPNPANIGANLEKLYQPQAPNSGFNNQSNTPKVLGGMNVEEFKQQVGPNPAMNQTPQVPNTVQNPQPPAPAAGSANVSQISERN